MPDGIIAIVVGGGAEFVAPITIGNLVKVNTISPPTLNDSLLRQVAASGGNVEHIVVGATDPTPVGVAPTETFRTQGGLISSYPGKKGSVVIGEAAIITTVSAVPSGVAIGKDATAGGSKGSVCIGFQANDSAAGNDSVIIGASALGGGGDMVVIGPGAFGLGGSMVVIGSGANSPNAAGSGQVVIGPGATNKSANATCIGLNAATGTANGDLGAIAIGSGAICQGGRSQSIGYNAQILTNGANSESMAIGSSATVNNPNTNALAIGPNTTANHSNCILLGERIASDFARQFKVGFGAGGVATLPIYGVFIGGPDTYASYEGITYRHVNGSGADNSVGPLQFVSPLGTGNGVAAVGGLTAGIEFYTGAVGASSSTVQAQTLNFKVLPQTATPTNTDAPVAFPNYFDGANGQAGTLLNAPKAGDPQAWLPFNLKGTVHWVPAWHL